MAPEAPNVDVQLEGARSADQSITVMLLQTHYRENLTMPLKDATSPVHYLG